MKKAEMKLMRETIAKCIDRRGRVRPDLVVAAARRAKTPGEKLLYTKFEWKVEAAAMQHWLDTAAALIREVKLQVVYEDVRIVAPYYVSDPLSSDRAYLETAKVAKSEDLAEQVLRDELARIMAAIDRARAMAKVFGLNAHLDRMLNEAVRMRQRLDERKGKGDDDRPTA